MTEPQDPKRPARPKASSEPRESRGPGEPRPQRQQHRSAQPNELSQSGSWPGQSLKPGRIAGYVVLLVLGFVVGAAGSLVQAAWFPAGLLLALAGSAGLFYGGVRAVATQFGALVPAAGWIVAVLLLSAGRPEGDGLFVGGLGEMLFLLGGVALAVICATMSRAWSSGGRTGSLGA
ncbi:DUF6113 family protein [Streptomyces sp. NPDC127084]|uniref:DUF6113 family protein n=1 Tax=Streptomyces sp. NPDC127084 TaxID=3347133 RepID=UPI003665A7CA